MSVLYHRTIATIMQFVLIRLEVLRARVAHMLKGLDTTALCAQIRLNARFLIRLRALLAAYVPRVLWTTRSTIPLFCTTMTWDTYVPVILDTVIRG